MFCVWDRRGSNERPEFGIVDLRDGVIEYYNYPSIIEMVTEKDIKIHGIDIKFGKVFCNPINTLKDLKSLLLCKLVQYKRTNNNQYLNEIFDILSKAKTKTVIDVEFNYQGTHYKDVIHKENTNLWMYQTSVGHDNGYRAVVLMGYAFSNDGSINKFEVR